MSDAQLERLYKQLDGISASLQTVQRELHSVVRLQEQVNNHTETLQRFGNKIEESERRIRKVELWQAERSDTAYFDIMLAGVSEKLTALENRVNAVESVNDAQNSNMFKNQQSTTQSALKWVSGILASIIVAILLLSFKGD